MRAVAVGAVLLLMAGVLALSFRARPDAGGVSGGIITLAPDDARLVADGRVVYAESCAVCHGATLEGHPAWSGGSGDGLAPPLSAAGPSPSKSDAELVEITRAGTANGMPGFAGALSDAEIRAVLSYIESTWPPEARVEQPAE
jgi:mono/diheme cytochrome c family protein